ncbi:hypothetical protein [Actinocatenispora comari]|jgi:hypothetical protein|uniref:Uncharacterized protein n=1 Tax=Actinocatenispora comari TaxID=2807577 RepID=A0A8J4EPT1_9ACTN|nr:hypothetical protein [Actinocatenispora comari]GIL31690.1 hypothetical protein NUM_69440 [Actinocatenispora comari]
MLDRIRRRLLSWPHRGGSAVASVADPYEGAQRLAQRHQAIRRTLAEIRAERVTSQH